VFEVRDFAVANLGIAVMGFVAMAMILPLMFYLQTVCGLSPTRSAVATAPMAIATGLLAPVVGRIVDRSPPLPIIGFGFAALSIALTWLSFEMTPTAPIWRLLLPLTAMGVAMAFIWSPLAATATRNLPSDLAGAGSGVYNATRLVGSVLGSAGMAAFMTWRISDELPVLPTGGAPRGEAAVTQLPAFLHQPFSDAMSQSTLLPAFVSLFGVVAALFLLGARAPAKTGQPAAVRRADVDDEPAGPLFALPEADRAPDEFGSYFDDDDYYAEYVLAPPEPEPDDQPDDIDTDRITMPVDPARGEHVELSAKDTFQRLYHEPPDRWLRKSAAQIGFAHNGFHVYHGQRLHGITDIREQRPQSRHSKRAAGFDPDADTYGRHAMPTPD
jgi:hypothetical protein